MVLELSRAKNSPRDGSWAGFEGRERLCLIPMPSSIQFRERTKKKERRSFHSLPLFFPPAAAQFDARAELLNRTWSASRGAEARSGGGSNRSSSIEESFFFFFFFLESEEESLSHSRPIATSAFSLVVVVEKIEVLRSKNVEKGLPPAVQLGPARVLELGAGGDRALPEQGPRGGVRKRGAGSPYVLFLRKRLELLD